LAAQGAIKGGIRTAAGGGAATAAAAFVTVVAASGATFHAFSTVAAFRAFRGAVAVAINQALGRALDRPRGAVVIASATVTTVAAASARFVAVALGGAGAERFANGFARGAAGREFSLGVFDRFVTVIGIVHVGAFDFGSYIRLVMVVIVRMVMAMFDIMFAGAQVGFRPVFVTARRFFGIVIVAAGTAQFIGAGVEAGRAIIIAAAAAGAWRAPAGGASATTRRETTAASATATGCAALGTFAKTGVTTAFIGAAGANGTRAGDIRRSRFRVTGLGSGAQGGRRLARIKIGSRRFGGAFRARRGC
jgi:hypothetical protein